MRLIELSNCSYNARKLSAKRTWRKRFVFKKSDSENTEREIVGHCLDYRFLSTLDGVTVTC